MSAEPHDGGALLYAAVLDAADVGPGTALLDLGCGAGLFARAAADRGATVTGVDLDPGAVEQAAAAVPEGTFVARHAQDPPPGRFDVAAAVQLLMHVADPVAVLHAAGRAAPVVVATVWGRRAECDLRLFEEALSPWLGPPSGPEPAVSQPARLRAMAERAGLRVERVEEVVCPFEYADEDQLLRSVLASGPARAVARRASAAEVRTAVLEHLEPNRTADGRYRLHNLFRVLLASRP